MVRYVHVEEERNVLGLLSCAVLEGLTFLRVQRNSNASAVVLRSDYPSIQNNSAMSLGRNRTPLTHDCVAVLPASIPSDLIADV